MLPPLIGEQLVLTKAKTALDNEEQARRTLSKFVCISQLQLAFNILLSAGEGRFYSRALQ